MVLVIILLIASCILYARQKRSNVISNGGQQQQPDGIYNHSNQNITINTNLRGNCDKSLLKTVLVIATLYQAFYWLTIVMSYLVFDYLKEEHLALYQKLMHNLNFIDLINMPIVCIVMNKDFRMSF